MSQDTSTEHSVSSNSVDVAIIGAGTAGLTAAIYTVRAGLRVAVFEGQNYGGQIINTPSIDNYPGKPGVSGFEYSTDLYNQAKDLGAEIIFAEVEKVEQINGRFEVQTTQENYHAKSVIIATGTINRKLGLEHESELAGKGISYCATCDGSFFKDKIVAVNGGGNTAIEDALYLSKIAAKVYLVHHSANFRAEATSVDELRSKANVELITDADIVKLTAGSNGLLESIELSNGRTLELNGLFVAIGRTPANEKFANLVDLDKNGHIVASELCETKTAGVYAAGDCRTKEVRQLVTAASDGAIAAKMVGKHLK